MTTPRADASAPSPASEFSVAFLAELLRGGVRDVVVCPGSRSQALALAAAEFERAGVLRLRVRIDERSAAFLAVGLARESRSPVVVVTTSGTAVANLLPAVLEASHSGIPLIFVTADRPEELLGIGANQATVQAGIFGSAVTREWDVAAPTSADGAEQLARDVLAAVDGPVHVNLALRDPLSGAVELPTVTPGTWTAPAPGDPVAVEPGPRTVVVAGTEAGPRAEEVARELGAPLLAEVTSGSRFGPNLVPAYRELLRDPEFADPIQRVVVFGHPTLSREIPALLSRPDVDAVVVRGNGRDAYDPGRRARIVAGVTVDGQPLPESRGWVGSWVHASRGLLAAEETPAASLGDDRLERAAFARTQLERLREPVARRMLVDAVWANTWPHDRLVLGASRLIRDLDRVAPGKRIPVFANRGLAGIDGTIATATGVALAAGTEGAGVTRVLLGDLALLHDAGSLAPTPGEPTPRMQVIVGNDGGGTIFDALEVAGTADPELFDRVLYTPQAVEIPALAAAYGWEYRRAATRAELDDALTASGDRVLIEVPLPSRGGLGSGRMKHLLRAGPGVDLAAIDTSGTPGFEGDKEAGEEALAAGADELAELQERLFAASRSGDTRSVLLVLQAMDTAGKGGIVKHVVGSVDPQGVSIAAFKRPTPEEEAHDFLWRIRKRLPAPGMIGVFDRSHYESVLIHRVRGLSTPEEVEARYPVIVDFENELVAAGTTIVKVMLHISKDEQKQRLMERLDRPDKHWKYNPGDVDERAFWEQYMDAYRVAIEKTSTDDAPWYVVPADKKWYARLAVQHLMLDALRSLDARWPAADFDVEVEKQRLAAT